MPNITNVMLALRVSASKPTLFLLRLYRLYFFEAMSSLTPDTYHLILLIMVIFTVVH